MLLRLCLGALAASQAASLGGDASCPCLASVEVSPWQLSEQDVAALPSLAHSANASALYSSASYGVGCLAHDDGIGLCELMAEQQASCDGVSPLPDECITPDWCSRQWCYVDPAACDVLHRPTYFFPHTPRVYSYASCLEPDDFFGNEAIALRGQTLRVAYRHNSEYRLRNARNYCIWYSWA